MKTFVSTKKVFKTTEISAKKAKKGEFNDVAFGVLKNSFGKKSAVFYVAKLRKSWR